MSKPKTGLGDPEPQGKKALFQPPKEKEKETEKMVKKPKKESSGEKKAKQRYTRTTIKLPLEEYAFLQTQQHQYRLKTGKALPLWKAVSRAIRYYRKKKEG